jgi:hypothetical protein
MACTDQKGNPNMRNRTRLLLTGLIAALALSAAVTTAHARRIELSNQRIRAVWTATEPLQLIGAFEVAIRCRVTIEGTFHSRTLSKVSGQLVGYITSAAVQRPCTNGEAWVQNGTEEIPPGSGLHPNSLPWHILYISFRGTLPNITNIRLSLREVGFLVRGPFSTSCLYRTTNTSPAMGEIEVSAGEVTGLTPDETVPIPPFTTLEGFCSSGRFAGRGTVTLQGSTTTRIRVRLVQ